MANSKKKESKNLVLYGRYDLYDSHDIADFFARSGLNVIAVPEATEDDPHIVPADADHVGEYILGHAGYRLEGQYFSSPEACFEFVISHQFSIMGWISFITNHHYHNQFPDNEKR